MNIKLLTLANEIYNRHDFNQDIPNTCVIGIGLELIGLKASTFSSDTSLFAANYAVTFPQANALYWAKYQDLFPDELNHNASELYRVTRQEASRVLRRLATGRTAWQK